METESQELERYARGYVTVNLDAIVSNMRHMKAKLAEQTKMMGVIKTDGYGHGAIPIARQLEMLWQHRRRQGFCEEPESRNRFSFWDILSPIVMRNWWRSRSVRPCFAMML